MSDQWRDWSTSLLTALATVTVATSVMAQPTRISNNSTEFSDFNRVIQEGISRNGIRRDLINPQTEVDLRRVDKRVLQNLLDECVTESTRLYRNLEQDYRRYPELRTILSEVVSLRARASRSAQDLRAGIELERLLPEFQQLGSEWRLVSHQLSQSRRVSSESRDSIERVDRLERELEKLFKLEPQLDRRALLLEFSRLEGSVSNLAQELELDRSANTSVTSLIYDTRKLDQQVYLIQQRLLDQYSYTDIVSEYGRFGQMWSTLQPQLRSLNNRYLERGLRNITLIDDKIHNLLYLEQTTNRDNLRMLTQALVKDVDEFFNRVPLKLMLNFRDVSSILQTSHDFYGTVQNLEDCLARNENNASIMDCYRHVEEYGNNFIRSYEQLKSTSGRVVLREIEDGMMALRNELNITGSATSIDNRHLLMIAASLDNLADHMSLDVQAWLNSERPSYRNQALEASNRFQGRAQDIHHMLQNHPTESRLRTEVDDLRAEFETLYRYLAQCRTSHRTHLRTLAYEVADAIKALQTPLNL